MVLTSKQWNVVVVAHYVAMFDLLTTIVGVTLGGVETNPLFNRIDSLPIMFAVMLIVNIVIIGVIVIYLNIINKGNPIRYNLPVTFTTALLIVSGFRLYFGPITNLITIWRMI